MGQQDDFRAVSVLLHQRVTAELLQLMDGFYNNIEDSFFEQAYRHDEETVQQRYFELMRELRYRRASLLKVFAAGLERNARKWLGEGEPQTRNPNLEKLAAQMAHRCSSHFRLLLSDLTERTEWDTGNGPLPIGPQEISYHFVHSCRALDFDQAAVDIVRELFARFVLERLGGVYAQCNSILAEGGYRTAFEAAEAEQASA